MKARRRADAVVTDIAAEIITGRFPAGSVLPTEHVLGERFEVSRTVVREALARLAGVGLIEVRHGLGSVVLPRASWREIDADLLRIRTEAGLIDDLLPDLFDIRRMVELEVAERAARQRTPQDLATLSGIMEQLYQSMGDPQAYNAADIAFHDALIAASGNELLRVLIAPISQVWRIGSMVTMRRDPDVVTYSMQGHEEIFAAISAGDPVAARAAMDRHLDRFEQRLERALQLVAAQEGTDRQGRLAALADEEQTR
ncbi:MAG: FadR/GntR family transcriptional regulator [Thermomicrobiales bacterium]